MKSDDYMQMRLYYHTWANGHTPPRLCTGMKTEAIYTRDVSEHDSKG